MNNSKMSLSPEVATPSPIDLYTLRVNSISPRINCEQPACLVCGEQTGTPTFRVDDARWTVVVCAGCGLGRLTPLPSSDEMAEFYPSDYYGASGKKFRGLVEKLVRLVGARHATFLARHAPRGGRILDVGCGRGVTLAALADRGFETHGFEVSGAAAEGLDPRIQLRVASDLSGAAYPDGYFDKVMIWHVIEHVSDPRALLVEAHRILKPGGLLVVAAPNFSSWQARWAGEAWFHLDLPRHLTHFPASSLRQLMTATGFECGRAHHFSLRQNPFGWIQSCWNRSRWVPRNALYLLLHRRLAGDDLPLTTLQRRMLRLSLWILAPVALALSVLETVARQGATVHILGRKR